MPSTNTVSNPLILIMERLDKITDNVMSGDICKLIIARLCVAPMLSLYTNRKTSDRTSLRTTFSKLCLEDSDVKNMLHKMYKC